MNDEFVRKDVFDAEMNGLRNVAAVSLDALHSRLDSLEKRLDDIKDEVQEVRDPVVRNWTIVGVIAALGAFVFTAFQLYLSVKGV